MTLYSEDADIDDETFTVLNECRKGLMKTLLVAKDHGLMKSRLIAVTPRRCASILRHDDHAEYSYSVLQTVRLLVLSRNQLRAGESK